MKHVLIATAAITCMSASAYYAGLERTPTDIAHSSVQYLQSDKASEEAKGPRLSEKNTLAREQLALLSEKIDEITADIHALKARQTEPDYEYTQTVLNEQDMIAQAHQFIEQRLDHFNSQPVDHQQQLETENAIGYGLDIHQETLAEQGIFVSDFECRSTQCRLNVSASTPGDVYEVQAYLPFASESDFLPDPLDNTQGTLFVTKIEPLYPDSLRD